MYELLKALRAFERLGAEWKARRVTKVAPYDTVECTTLVQTSRGVVRGLVEVRRGDTYSQTKAEVACYLDGKLDDKDEFKYLKHPKAKAAKLYEHESTVLMRHSAGFLGLGRGYRPNGTMPEEHRFLTDFAERLISAADRKGQTDEETKASEKSARKSANEARAKQALFG